MLAAVAASLAAVLGVGCSRPPAPPPLVAQTSGTIAIAGLSRPVRIVRDTWGVPHIYAESEDDLFVAQGFVQAQDRLFQMDLWKRASEGRLSQVLGSNFIERDAMTRRFQYRGEAAAEWASYGPGAHRIARAFVSGINAWVELARARPPEPFVLAGWKPEFWVAEDLLSRTDAFLASGNALAEVARKGMSDVVGEAIRRVGTPPFFVALAAPVADGRSGTDGSSADGIRQGEQPFQRADTAAATARAPGLPASGVASPGRLTFDDAIAFFEVPARRYLVHLHAPGWNVAGLTRPWLPGVAAGHNDTVAWAPVPVAADTQDVYPDPVADPQRIVTKEPIVVKGRRSPFVFDMERTPHGVVIASDRPHGLNYTLRWSGIEPGAAAELAALAVDRARSWTEFRAAAARWKMPVARLLYADIDGRTGFQDAGLIPRRRRTRPPDVRRVRRQADPRSGGDDWIGWETIDTLPHEIGDAVRRVASGAASEPSPGLVLFSSVLGVTRAARRRFDLGPLAPPGDRHPTRLDLDTRAWNGSRALDAPGQSESRTSPLYDNIATVWSAGEWMQLPFSDDAVRAAGRDTLMLVPKRPTT